MGSVAVYARLSQDDGSRESTQRQVKDCRTLAELKGWSVSAEYVDRDTSAYDRRVVRPEWERLLVDIERGSVDGVVVWKLDRLCRRVADFERFWLVCEERGAFLASVTEPIDTTTDLGVVIVRVLVAFAQLESATISTRTRRAKQASAAKGAPKHGGYRGFGHERDGRVDEAEARLLRDAVSRVLAGESLSSVARRWRELGVRTPTGGAWSTPHLRRLLMQPRLAGARLLDDGDWASSGAIAAIVSEEESRRVRRLLADPLRRTNHGRVHETLLAGLIHCGVCGARLETHAVRGRPVYTCRRRPERDGCGGVAVTCRLVDDYVSEWVVDAIDTPEVRAALAAPASAPMSELADGLAADRHELERLARLHFVERRIGEREYFAARDALARRISDAERSLSRDATIPAIIDAAEIRSAWPELPLDTRRSIIRLIVDRVECDPATRPTNVWRPDRVRITQAQPLAQ